MCSNPQPRSQGLEILKYDLEAFGGQRQPQLYMQCMAPLQPETLYP